MQVVGSRYILAFGGSAGTAVDAASLFVSLARVMMLCRIYFGIHGRDLDRLLLADIVCIEF